MSAVAVVKPDDRGRVNLKRWVAGQENWLVRVSPDGKTITLEAVDQ